MPYRYLEDLATADIAFEATGGSLEELFTCSAEALLNVMIENPEAVRSRIVREIELEEEALDLLLFNFLQEFIYFKDARSLLLRVRAVRIEAREDGSHRVCASTAGERLDPSRHEQRVDVKAVTLHHFVVERSAQGWRAQVILDI